MKVEEEMMYVKLNGGDGAVNVRTVLYWGMKASDIMQVNEKVR